MESVSKLKPPQPPNLGGRLPWIPPKVGGRGGQVRNS